MRELRKALAFGVVAGFLAGCGGGGGSPFAPIPAPTPSTTTLTVTDLDGTPLEGAAVTVGDQVFRTSVDGRALVTGHIALLPDGDVTIEAQGFYRRETIYRARSIWGLPRDRFTVARVNSLPDTYLRLAYGIFTSASTGAPRLMRLADGRYTVSASAAIRADPVANERLEDAIAELNARTNGQVTFALTDGTGADITIAIDPNLNQDYAGLAVPRLADRGGVTAIVGGEVYLSDLDTAQRRDTILHELGHILGLGHTMVLGDVMSGTSQFRFSANEAEAIKFMLARLPNTEYPDNDRRVR